MPKAKNKYLSCIDVYGNELMISKGKNGEINFTLHHDEVIEGCARTDFKNTSLRITSESGSIFKIAKGLYEISGSNLILSEDPIRDGKNFFFLEQESEESYYMTISRDLTNDLNLPNQTNIEITGQSYVDLYREATEEKGSQLVKKKELSQ